MEKYEKVTSILKFGDRSNGLTRNYAARLSVYVSGGLDNFILALLESSGQDLTVEEVVLSICRLKLCWWRSSPNQVRDCSSVLLQPTLKRWRRPSDGWTKTKVNLCGTNSIKSSSCLRRYLWTYLYWKQPTYQSNRPFTIGSWKPFWVYTWLLNWKVRSRQ
jgi:hypothetical protein